MQKAGDIRVKFKVDSNNDDDDENVLNYLYKSKTNDYQILRLLHRYKVENEDNKNIGFDITTKYLQDKNRYEHRVASLMPNSESYLKTNDEIIEINGIDVRFLNNNDTKAVIMNYYSKLVDDYLCLNILVARKVQNYESSCDLDSVLNKIEHIPSENFDYLKSSAHDYLEGEEFEKLVNTKFWRNARRIANFITFGLVSIIIVFMGVLIYLSPRCEPTPKVSWWQNAVVFKIDMDDLKINCIKDSCVPIKILNENVLKFASLHADAIWLTHMNNLSDGFQKIDSNYGTNEDLILLAKSLHDKDIKIIIDFIPNYTNDDHYWFRMSLMNNSKYFNYYVWKDKPNNWLTENNESAWSKVKTTDKYFYLHQYEKSKPDLNYANEEVYQYLLDSIKFWLDCGIDGLNLATISKLFEDSLFRDEISLNLSNKSNRSLSYQDYSHEYTRHRKETFHLIAEIKDLLANYNKTSSDSNENRILIVDTNELNNLNRTILLKYYGSNQINGFDWIVSSLDKDGSVESIKWSIYASASHKKSSFWMLKESPDSADAATYWSLVSYLPGSSVINLKNRILWLENENSTLKLDNITRTALKHEKDELEKILAIRNGLKSISYGYTMFTKNGFDKNLIIFKRYFDPEKIALLVFNLNRVMIKLGNNEINQELKELKLERKEFHVEHVLINQHEEINHKFETLENVKFDKYGQLIENIEIPAYSGLILSMDYSPPDLKDLL